MKKILIPFAAVMLSVTACTWNDYKNLDFIGKTPEEIDPEGYNTYLAAVKEFKSTEHPVMIVGMDGTASQPSAQPMHPMSMPDSADYIMMRNPLELHSLQVSEMTEVYQRKGTKTLAYIDLDVIREAWGLIQDQREESGLEPSTDEETTKYFTDETNKLLSSCGKYPFHGIVFSVIGAADVAQKAFFDTVFKWMDQNPEKESIFRGAPRNVYDKEDQEMLEKCEYVIVVAGKNTTEGELTLHATRILGSSNTKDRVLMEVTVPSSATPQQVGADPQTAASWVVNEKNNKKFTPRGVVVANANDDYYRNEMIFVNVRKAITIMNTEKEQE